MSLRRQN